MDVAPHPDLPRLAAHLLAIDPAGLCGAVLRGSSSPERAAWLAALRSAMPDGAPWRRMPPNVGEDRLLGGLDLAATLAAGRPVAERGLLTQADGGVLIAPRAERRGRGEAAGLAGALDIGEVGIERDGLASRSSTRFAAVLLDEGEGDEHAPTAIGERLAFVIDLDQRARGARDASVGTAVDRGWSADARHRAPRVGAGTDVVEAICATALAFGVPSLRIAIFALNAAKAAAALAGRSAVGQDDIALAAALVIAPRATTLPARDDVEDEGDDPPERPDPPSPEERDRDERSEQDENSGTAGDLANRMVEATRAAIPPGLLAELAVAANLTRRESPGGKAGALQRNAKRGRPAGIRRGMPGRGVRLAVVDTLRAAAPWQRVRRQALPIAPAPGRVLVKREDFRIARVKAKRETVTIFAVDASGSAALNRLAEVKGAVELILAECYVRRDQVALIAFRGERADLILPPTRSLTRAKRALAGQAGGGGTPLAAAIEAATVLADTVRRKGQSALVVLMTDGKANIGRSGQPGRAAAEADAKEMARAFRISGATGLVLDIAPRPAEPVRRLAASMGARYVPLPFADAATVSRTVLAAASNK